uniref:Uncharacterized protein n=1 Tax=Picea glauca TaxID=3330 RepID=A0A101M260_PICGL|nr:hypothetical protein ABT39_MTgene2752 [Picea glauca]
MHIQQARVQGSVLLNKGRIILLRCSYEGLQCSNTPPPKSFNAITLPRKPCVPLGPPILHDLFSTQMPLNQVHASMQATKCPPK